MIRLHQYPGKRLSFCLVSITLAGLFLMIAPPAFGQLTPEDISALQKRGLDEGWTFTVGENGATQYPLEQLCGLKEPANWQDGANFDPCTPTRELPTYFDWRDSVTLPPVKSQGGCGSCWAFATVGPLECNIKIKDDITVNLSEQYLVSCNKSDWGCDGGWWAHSYHMTAMDYCGDKWAVLESDFPYAAADLPCSCPFPHNYRIQSWSYVGSQHSIPSVEAMKQAILDYGPISVAVVSNSAMHGYNGGVFNSCTYGSVNHGVVLVGWDDNQGSEGVWFMRNSWGTWWGEDGGYMRIEYGCSKIGYGASYVNYPGVVRITTESMPVCSLGIGICQQFEATGGTGVKTWTDRDSSLAAFGLTLSTDGLLTGIPNEMGPLSFVAHVVDQYGSQDEKTFVTEILRSYVCGDANRDELINVGDAIYVINYVFKQGPAPAPIIEAGDANCEGNVNVADAVFLINHVFKNGGGPCCP
jgi:hypothetical protein